MSDESDKPVITSFNEVRRLQARSEELSDWHATFPGFTPVEILKLLDEREKLGVVKGLRMAIEQDKRMVRDLTALKLIPRSVEYADSYREHLRIADHLESELRGEVEK